RRRHALLHPEGIDPEHLAGREVHDPRGHRKPFHRPEQRQRTEEVGLDRLTGVRPHGVHPDDGGEMDHAVHPLHDPAQRVGVEDVPEHHADVALAVMAAHRPARAAELAVEDHDLVVDTQPVRQGGADEPGPTGDENPLSARLSGFCHQVLAIRVVGLPCRYSTVTLFAKLRGRSTSQPRATAMWYASSCNGMTVRTGESSDVVAGTERRCWTRAPSSSSPSVVTAVMSPPRPCP